MKQCLGFLTAFCVLSILFLAGTTAQAHVLSTNASGNNKHWPGGAPEFYANYLNTSGLSSSDIFTSITNALGRWKAAGTASISFDFWQGSTTVNPVVALDGRNVIFFQSQTGSTTLGSGVIGVTYVYSSGSNIVETDVVLNDRDFTFTTVSTDSTNGSFLSSNVFVENVLTHELGHAYGLSHSNYLQSTMMWQEAKGQSKPSCDDVNGMAVLYPNSSYTSSLGSISGTVRSATGATAVFGAYVHAISKRRGIATATAISGPAGTFTISNLEPGSYNIMVEPFTNIVSSLCGGSASGCYFGTANAGSVCTGSTAFSRFFIESTAGRPAFQTVTAGSDTALGNINVNCSAMTQASALPAVFGTAPTVLATATGSSAVSGVFTAVNDVHYYKLTGVAGTIKAKALSYSLYSPVDIDVDIRTGALAGTSVVSAHSANVFPTPAPGGAPYPYINYDGSASYTAAPSGTYYVTVSYGATLTSTKYPGSAALDATPFYLLIITVGDTTALVNDGDGNPYLTENARCEKTDSFIAYPNRGAPSALSASSSGSSSSTSSSIDTGGICGVIREIGSDRDGPSGPGASAVFSAWGLLFMMLLSRLAFKLSRRYY